MYNLYVGSPLGDRATHYLQISVIRSIELLISMLMNDFEVILLAQFIYISCSQYLQFWVPNLFDIGHLFSREICG